MVFCSICGNETKKRICKNCQYLIDNGADEDTFKRMKSNDFVNEIWKKNEEYSKRLANAYYNSLIENYKKTDDSKENFGYNTFIDGIRLGLDIIIPMLDEEKRIEVQEKIDSMIELRKKQNKRKIG